MEGRARSRARKVATVSLSYDEAYAQVTAPGQMFELTDGVVDGVDVRLFKHAPSMLGQVFAGARGVTSTFMVYEDERVDL